MKNKKFLVSVFLALFLMGTIFAQAEDAEFYNNQGMDFYNEGNYVKAIEAFTREKEILEKTVGKEHQDYASTINNLGVMHEFIGDYKQAEQYYLEAKAIQERVLGKEHPDYNVSLDNLGNFYFGIGEYNQAEKYWLELKDIKARVNGKEHQDYTFTLHKLARLYFLMGNYKQAEQYYLETKAIEERVLGKEHPDYAATLNGMGDLYRVVGDYSQAEQYYLEAKAIEERVLGKEHPEYASTVDNLGLLYINIGDYNQAELNHIEAKTIREQVLGKDHRDYAASLNNLGVLYQYMGDYPKAEQYYLESMDTKARILGKDHPDYAFTLINLSAIYASMGDYKQAEYYYLISIDICTRVLGKDHPAYATLLNNLGLMYNDDGDYIRAEQCYLEAKSIREQVLGKNHPDYALTLNNLGALYWSMGDYERAEPYYLEAADIRERVLGKDHADYAQSLNNIGLLYYSMENFDRAEQYLLESKDIKERILGKDHPDYLKSLENLSTSYFSNKKYDRALELRTETNLLNESQVNRNFAFLSEQQRNVYWNVKASSFELSYSFSCFYPVPASNILNYDNALFSKGLLLRTTNAVRDAIYSSGNQTLIAQYEELGILRQQISALQQNGGNEEYIRSLETRADALDKSLTQASAAFRDFQADLNLGWKDVQDSLQEKEAAVEFVSFVLYDKKWTDKTLYAALVLKPGMEAPVWIPLCEETVLAELFEKASGKNPLLQTQILYDEYGSELYKAVWQPLEKTLENVTSIYYSPSGLLHKIAFNAIPVGDESRLMDKYDLYLVSSTREVVARKNKTEAKTSVFRLPRTAVIYGGIFYDANESSMKAAARGYNAPETQTRGLSLGPATEIAWGYLSATVPESEDIRGLFTQNKTTAELFSGNNGNEESFKALSRKKTAVIHLATHGFFIEDIEKNYEDRERLERLGGGQKALENPLLRSGLILAGANNSWTGKPVDGVEDGILFANEVARMNLLGTDLVVMSACETGLGTVNNGEGVFGLQRAFKLAGVNTLIMSLWSVSDDATSILMRVFYQNWLSGKSKQDALKEAQKTLRSSPQFSAPFYWAAFVMMD